MRLQSRAPASHRQSLCDSWPCEQLCQEFLSTNAATLQWVATQLTSDTSWAMPHRARGQLSPAFGQGLLVPGRQFDEPEIVRHSLLELAGLVELAAITCALIELLVFWPLASAAPIPLPVTSSVWPLFWHRHTLAPCAVSQHTCRFAARRLALPACHIQVGATRR